MVASNDSIEQVVQVVLNHVDATTAREIVKDLLEIPGNKSFRETVSRIADRLKVKVSSVKSDTELETQRNVQRRRR